MTDEAALIAALRGVATHPAARGLADDAAVLGDFVLTKDMLVEGVHYRPGDPPADVAWKLLAVNLSDLAAKGAVPVGVLLGFTLGDEAWDRAFVEGLGAALSAFHVPLLGGDTVGMPAGSARVLSMTAIGRAAVAPSRSSARPGDGLWLAGTIGDAGAGLRLLAADGGATGPLVDAYRRPVPLLAAGQALAPHVSAMMDVSDGLLIDAARMAKASDAAVTIDLDAIPLSTAGAVYWGGDRIGAATAGDDYALLFASAVSPRPEVRAVRIGAVSDGSGLSLHSAGKPVPLPSRLGWMHG